MKFEVEWINIEEGRKTGNMPRNGELVLICNSKDFGMTDVAFYDGKEFMKIFFEDDGKYHTYISHYDYWMKRPIGIQSKKKPVCDLCGEEIFCPHNTHTVETNEGIEYYHDKCFEEKYISNGWTYKNKK